MKLTRTQVPGYYGWLVEVKDAAAPSDREAGVFFVECRKCLHGRHVPAEGIEADDLFEHANKCHEPMRNPPPRRPGSLFGESRLAFDQAQEDRREEERFRHDEEAEARRFGMDR